MNPIDLSAPLALLGELSPMEFMRRHWQREPLLIRQAIPGFRSHLSMGDIRKLVQREEVESRLIRHDDSGWTMKQGPFSRLPAMHKPGWTVLAQNVDLHDDGMAALMRRFRFLPDARLDDVMISIAGPGGGVGPHFDSYDVFLLQAHGRRRWRVSAQTDLELEPGLPLKILKDFRAEAEYVLEPGDMLYLPPRIAHDGLADDACMTISIGFRAPDMATLAQGMLHAAADQLMAQAGMPGGLYADPPLPMPDLGARYGDAGHPPTATPALLPAELVESALAAARRLPFDETLAARFLGVWLTEPPAAAVFEEPSSALDLVSDPPRSGRLVLDRCTRMMYWGAQLFINGEVAPVPASESLCRLADARGLDCAGPAFQALTQPERAELELWFHEGWLHHAEP